MRKQADMRRQGRGWILQVYDPAKRAWIESSTEMSYYEARWWIGYYHCRRPGSPECRMMDHNHAEVLHEG
jgi:hypothetical protein